MSLTVTSGPPLLHSNAILTLSPHSLHAAPTLTTDSSTPLVRRPDAAPTPPPRRPSAASVPPSPRPNSASTPSQRRPHANARSPHSAPRRSTPPSRCPHAAPTPAEHIRHAAPKQPAHRRNAAATPPSRRCTQPSRRPAPRHAALPLPSSSSDFAARSCPLYPRSPSTPLCLTHHPYTAATQPERRPSAALRQLPAALTPPPRHTSAVPSVKP